MILKQAVINLDAKRYCIQFYRAPEILRSNDETFSTFTVPELQMADVYRYADTFLKYIFLLNFIIDSEY